MRLLTLALCDDLVALVVIATAYSSGVSLIALAVAIGLVAVLGTLKYAPRAWRTRTAAVLGVPIWVAMYESGIDPVIAGLVVGLATNAYLPHRATLGQAVERIRLFREQPTPELARIAQRSVASAISPNERLEHLLHPWTSYAIVPMFGLANAGIHLNGQVLSRAFGSPITLGILIGYGLESDWLKNVMAGGPTALHTWGRAVTLANPKIVAKAEAAPLITPVPRLLYRLFPYNEAALVLTRPADTT